ncbi:hypothetical protein Tco_1082648 [Tanacetum coccineum]|uniref:Uncharacterized protein n=1 Tax=Tanacetum coccineum TaxID=301880 RepID=A0ABQ5I356_9ASTR
MERVEKGTIELYYFKKDYQLADLFTKALPVDRFNCLVRRLGMCSLSLTELERLTKSRQNRRDLPRNSPLDRVEVLVLSALRRSVMRTASAAAKPCQGDSSEFYLITGNIYID